MDMVGLRIWIIFEYFIIMYIFYFFNKTNIISIVIKIAACLIKYPTVQQLMLTSEETK